MAFAKNWNSPIFSESFQTPNLAPRSTSQLLKMEVLQRKWIQFCSDSGFATVNCPTLDSNARSQNEKSFIAKEMASIFTTFAGEARACTSLRGCMPWLCSVRAGFEEVA